MAGSRGIIAWYGPLVIIVMSVGIALIGAAFGLASVIHRFGIFNIVLYLPAVAAAGFVSVWTVRLAVLRHSGAGILMGCAFLVVFLSSMVYTAMAASPAGLGGGGLGDVWAFLGERRRTGITLWGSYVPIRGWLLVTLWILGIILAMMTFLLVPVAECGRPFCNACRSWAWKKRWHFWLNEPWDAELAHLKMNKSLTSLLKMRPGTPVRLPDRKKTPTRRLECKLGSCNCGRLATVAADLVKTNAKGEKSSDPVVNDLPAPPAMRIRLFEWAEAIDPSMVSRRPKVALAANGLASDEARRGGGGGELEADPRPATEHISTTRWNNTLGASDSYCNNRYTRELRARLDRGEYDLIEKALGAQTHAEDYAFVAEACADWDKRPAWLDEWAEAEPESSALPLIRGISSIKCAWQARGIDWVPKNYAQFQLHLKEAEEDLYIAAERAPHDATPWAWLLYSGKGRQHDQEVIQTLLREAHKRVPFHRPAYSMARDWMSPKWGGNAERMMSLVRKVTAAAPAGNHVHVIVAEAHLELAANAERENGKGAGAAYWNSPGVADEIRRANEKCFRPGAHRLTMDTPRTRAFFAYALWKAGAKEHAAEHLRIIGRSTPWGPFVPNLPFMRDTVRRARRECGA